MSITISAKPDYSSLFSSLSSNSTGDLTSMLSDYASIKNGSYGKLMKAYYAKVGTDNTSSKTNTTTKPTSSATTADTAAKLSAVQNASDEMKESADALYATGTKSLFNKKDVTTKDANGVETTAKAYDADAIYKAVSSFVEDYNSLLTTAESAASTSITNLVSLTNANKSLLSDMGITVKTDNTLSIDEATFKKADMSTVKSLFNGSGSYAYSVSAQASFIDLAASNEASKANTYTASGAYGSNFATGSILDSLY